jgi:hypothetical protein
VQIRERQHHNKLRLFVKASHKDSQNDLICFCDEHAILPEATELCLLGTWFFLFFFLILPRRTPFKI